MKRFIRRLQSRLGPVLQSDTAFIAAAYLEILGRPADQDGLNHYRRLLRDGLGRTAVLLSLLRSEESTRRLPKAPPPPLADLRARRPDRYRTTVDRTNGETIPVFDAAVPADFDWLESAILDRGYYEQPGVWNFGVDIDKRVVAEIIAAFAPRRVIELGCAAGAVLECLDARGIAAEGIEISSMAIEKAAANVRSRIHHGDVLALDLPADYDVVFGLDVFEHLNPNRIGAYLARLCAITRDGGFLYCNIPAFGEDAVFGTVFPLYIESWERDAAAGRPFSTLHVDDLGYPIHGHLTWADARWWTARFEAAGFTREVTIERALHAKYGEYMQKRSPARRALFVFGKAAADHSRTPIVRRIRSQPSRVLLHR
ncbi:MAG: hypothetical protein A3G21_13845 [Acidobacteria bacterium RIFCSPLOWO2_12_FULL_66_21]|nr:MAG: hypothetical protein A3G21_13845 [Acidobacteria bacterium RIFCSPLOWO2_12_FULL_66_21]